MSDAVFVCFVVVRGLRTSVVCLTDQYTLCVVCLTDQYTLCVVCLTDQNTPCVVCLTDQNTPCVVCLTDQYISCQAACCGVHSCSMPFNCIPKSLLAFLGVGVWGGDIC